MSHLCRTKTQEGYGLSRNWLFSAQSCTLEAGWSNTPTQKLLVRSWTGPKKFKILSFHQMLFNFIWRTDRQIHRQDTCPPPSYRERQKNLMPYFDTFHFTTFALPCPFVKDETFEVKNFIRKQTFFFPKPGDELFGCQSSHFLLLCRNRVEQIGQTSEQSLLASLVLCSVLKNLFSKIKKY